MRFMLGAFGLLISAAATLPAVAAEPVAPSPPVVAIVGEAGLNPAHEDFRDSGAARPALPPHTVIQLPDVAASEGFAELEKQMAAGPLGRLKPGELYRIDGTRLLVYIPSGLAAPYNLIERSEDASGDTPYRRHGTGVVGSAISSKHGTAPEAWAVFIATPHPTGYEWLAEQDWIDTASVSAYGLEYGPVSVDPGSHPLPCPAAPHVREFTRDRVFFASAGNSENSSLYLLNSMAEFYVVGGVDRNGSAVMEPHVPTSTETEEIFWSVPYSSRTFETGDRYEFRTSDFDSVDGTDRFGGTSGATPTTAGRAATVLTAARALLGDDGTRPAELLAEAGGSATIPSTGPLADGTFTAAELSDVLHAAASPKLVGPARYFVEGYGALDDAATKRATAFLRGDLALPSRPDDDRAHQASEEARRQHASLARGCG